MASESGIPKNRYTERPGNENNVRSPSKKKKKKEDRCLILARAHNVDDHHEDEEDQQARAVLKNIGFDPEDVHKQCRVKSRYGY